ncbi:hypothetical protein W97_09359 [Coniosporium apollinis CBS 100218]|uniref:Uncharacterized protein n=1 Tax=Coniosporium apollinis (strain CBS 100218) TaxID=1168221 RepID=R7Z7M4_CONA1|nr:uncharacterized protein W97_09359 [Coniosporium apollinis CBS 100218]EON70093.1 hypothetical protein W97_09359 [Coniosporium apollinis CBS 100218]
MAGELSNSSKYLAVPCLTVTTVIALYLVVAARKNNTYSGSLYNFVSANRATTQIIVQIVAFALGTLHLYVLTTLINFSSRSRLQMSPTKLDTIKMWAAVCSLRMDWSLPLGSWLILCALRVVALIPPALWAGAVTPVVTGKIVSSSIAIPVYSSDPTGLYWNRTWNPFRDANLTRNDKGTFSYAPGVAIQGIILQNAASTTSTNGSLQEHRKNDVSRLSYSGRSYGVGASAGIMDLTLEAAETIKGYAYFEKGYQSNVSCIRNSSSAWTIQQGPILHHSTYPNMYLASGHLPNTANVMSDRYYTLGLQATLDSKIVALLGRTANNRSIVAIAVGKKSGPYTSLKHIQCEVTFMPRNFSVNVDTDELVITVTPVGPADEIDPTSSITGPGQGVLIQETMMSLTQVSMINTDSYTSVVGDALLSEIANVAVATNAPLNGTAAVMNGMARALESMIDDILGAYSSAQLMIAGSDQPETSRTATDVSAAIRAVQIGNKEYIYAIMVINGLLILLFVAETIRTRGWRNLPAFDYQDIKSVIVGSYIGSAGAGQTMIVSHAWKGDSSDTLAGAIQVQLVDRDGYPALVEPSATDKNVLGSSSTSSGYVAVSNTEPFCSQRSVFVPVGLLQGGSED